MLSRSGATSFGSVVLGLGLALFLSAGSCVDSDVGAPCSLQKVQLDRNLPGCADATPQSVDSRPECFHPTLADLEAGREKEYVSFGVADCDNLTCVRSRGQAVPSLEGEPTGHCSSECITNDDCKSEGGGRFVCRELFLDQDFLAQLRENLTEAEYAGYFGRIQNTKFCAKPQ